MMGFGTFRLEVIALLVLSLSIALPVTLKAQQRSADWLIVGGSPQAVDVASLPGASDNVRISPFTPETRSAPYEAILTVDTSSATDLLEMSEATAVWDHTSFAGPFLHVIPFDAYSVTSAQDWERVSSGLEQQDNNTLIISEAHGEFSILEYQSRDQIRRRWDDLFNQYATMRVLGFDNTVYVEPISDNAGDARVEILRRYSDELGSIQRSRSEVESHFIIDSLFDEVAEANASNDEIAALATVWNTEIRQIIQLENLDEENLFKVEQFLINVDVALTSSRENHCLVTVSTTGGEGAEIEFYKSLLDPNSATDFGSSTAQRLVERARWTFVSYRYIDGERVESGRRENVEFPRDSTHEVLIQEIL